MPRSARNAIRMRRRAAPYGAGKASNGRLFAPFALAATHAGAHYPRMFPQRTTKAGHAVRLAASVCLLLGAGAVHAGGGPRDVRVQIERAVGVAAKSPAIVAWGLAPARCAPTADSIAVEGNDIGIVLKSPDSGCGKTMTAFRVRIDTAAHAATSLQPGRVYRTRVYEGTSTASSSLAFTLLDTSDAESAPVPENGFWWSEASAETGPAVAGSGINTELQGKRLALSLFGIGGSGEATWYFGTTSLAGRTTRSSLVQISSDESAPTPLAGTAPSAQAGPRIELEFLSPSRARAYLVRSEGGRDIDVRQLMLSRSRFATGPVGSTWSGQWVLVGDENSAPQTFDFSEARSRDADAFRLEDAGKEATLDCRVTSGTDHPEICTLSAASLRLGDFDQIGIDHLAGQDSGGARVQLLRVPR